jgi:hypothetical protein
MKLRLLPWWAAVGLAGAMLSPLQAQEPMLEWKVKPSETLIGLSRQLLISPSAWHEIARLNNLPNPHQIRPGQVLRVPLRMVRFVPAAAQLVSVTGEVRIDGTARAAGTTVLQGQQVQTTANASAVMTLADGSRVRLPPSSLVEVALHRRYGNPEGRLTNSDAGEGWIVSSLRVLRGSVEVFATQVLRVKPLEVTTPTAVVGVRGTTFRVRFDDTSSTQNTHAEVVEGAVQLKPRLQAASMPLLQGQGALTDTSQASPRVASLLKAPDLSGVPALFERPLVRFSLPSAQTWRWQVASDSAFDQVVSDQRVPPGAEVRVAGLADGLWHVRARRLDALGIEGFDASTSFELKARPEPPAFIAPPPQTKQSVGQVEFSWAPNVDAPSAHLQVARDPLFTTLVAEQTHLSDPHWRLPLHEPGTYHWRLASVQADGGRGPFSDPQHFELRALPEPPTAATSPDGQSLVLAWSARPQDKQQVQLARDAQFTDIVAEAELTTTTWVVPQPGPGGTYYFRYRSIEPDGFTSPYSSTLSVDVPRGYGWLWVWLPALLAF